MAGYRGLVAGTPVRPMLATTGVLPTGAGWGYEFKWDGIRAITQVVDGSARFFARSGVEVTIAYPELAALGAVLGDGIVDGEIVVLDELGRPSFGAVADRMHVRDARRAEALAQTRPVMYMIFDLLALNGDDLSGQPYEQRRYALDALDLAGDNWMSPPMFTDGAATRDAAAENQLEGLMAKRLSSTYRPGLRSPDWVKVKINHTAEFVVGGWRPGIRTLGALFVGVPAPGGGLAYRGRVGGGISAASERLLLAALHPLAASTSPFATDIPRAETRQASWVRPELVIEVRYGQQTPDGRLRFSRFLRIRSDLTADEVDTAGEVDDG